LSLPPSGKGRQPGTIMTATMTSSSVLATRRAMAATGRRRKWKAFALIAPLALFLLAIFIIQISMLLYRAVDNPEVIQRLPRTLTALESWNGEGAPGANSYLALMEDLLQAKDESGTGSLARRLNYEIAGYRSLIFKTIRRLPFDADHELSGDEIKRNMLAIDKRWGEAAYWQAIA